jgi:6-phosphogluconolactonase
VDWAREVDAGDGDGEFVVEAFDTRDDLARALCLEVEENARGCLQERGAFTMAVPGGSVAKALRGLREAEGLDWDRVHVFFVNERPGEQKCAKLAKETWTEACGIPDANVHCVMASDDVEACAADYEKQMRSLDENQMPIDEENGMPVFDLILLGMGADGHVGSIYPNSAAANDETGACVLGVDMPGKRTVTMSMALINTADRVVLAATGSEKAETVRAALEDELEWGEIPGSMVDAFSTIWFLDLAAASKLSAYEDMDMDTDDDE